VATFETNSDGTTIVILSESIKVGKEELTRCTIPKLRGKHLFKMPAFSQENIPLGIIVEWATHIVEPRGAVDEMVPKDANAVAHKLMELYLGKSPATGEKPSA
jgi:hypothetical protein